MRLPLILGIGLLIFGLMLDFYIYHRLHRSTAGRAVKLAFLCSAAVTNLLMLVIIIWPKRDVNADIIPVMWLLYAWITVYLSKLVYCLTSWIGLIPRLWKGRSLKCGKYVGLPLAIIVFITLWYGAIWGRRSIHIENVTVTSPKLPPAFEGYRIVQFSDAHVGTWGTDTTFISKLVTEINALHPNIIVFTGDIVNRKTDEIQPFIKVLSRLHAPDGVYSIMGNHDYGDYSNWPSEAEHQENTLQLRRIQKQMGWKLLEDEHIWLRAGNDSIALIGVENWGEPPFPSYGDFEKATKGLDANTFNILLSHNPMHWHSIVRESAKADLTLSGHTHAMQMRLRTPWKNYSLSALKYPEWEGMTEYTRPDGSLSRVYVNIGCGEVGFPARIGADPEITVITLNHD